MTFISFKLEDGLGLVSKDDLGNATFAAEVRLLFPFDFELTLFSAQPGRRRVQELLRDLDRSRFCFWLPGTVN